MYISVLEILEENVKANPDRIAFCDDKSGVSYIELYNKSKAIASYIISQLGNGKTRQPIAVCIDRNIESIIAFMGILYSGNFYVPIDVNMPAERIGIIFDDLKPQMILSSDCQKIDGYDITDVHDIWDSLVDEQKLDYIRRNAIDTDPIYAIFTSGSTGRPKGVLVSQRSVIDLVEQFEVAFEFPEEPILGNQAPFDFDVSVKDIYNGMYQHGTVCIIPKVCFSMPVKLIEFINEKKINTIIWAVSAMRIVENYKTFSHMVPNTLKLIMFSGEVMPVKVLNYWKEYIADATYVNLYGPTEITCNCTYYIVDRQYDADEMLPIGIPFRNTQVFLRNTETGEVVTEVSEQGEICVRGTCLALGYYNAPQRTAESFAQSPLSDAYLERIYRTGDLGFWDNEGLLHFTSRKDYQIKHMGHRIELGEIEVAVNAIDYIDAAVCVFDTKREKIVLFYQTNEGAGRFETSKLLERDIVKCLSVKLQKYMWPNVYISYEKLPLNKNGKIDRVFLANTLN